MKNILKFTGIVFAVALFAAGCASAPQNLAMATATEIGGYTSKDVEVSEVERGMTRVSWVAKTNDGRVFDCEADDMVRVVNVVERK